METWNDLAVKAGLTPAVIAAKTPDRISMVVAHRVLASQAAQVVE